MALHGYQAKISMLGVLDEYITQGTPEELYRLCGFDTEGIARKVREMLGRSSA